MRLFRSKPGDALGRRCSADPTRGPALARQKPSTPDWRTAFAGRACVQTRTRRPALNRPIRVGRRRAHSPRAQPTWSRARRQPRFRHTTARAATGHKHPSARIVERSRANSQTTDRAPLGTESNNHFDPTPEAGLPGNRNRRAAGPSRCPDSDLPAETPAPSPSPPRAPAHMRAKTLSRLWPHKVRTKPSPISIDNSRVTWTTEVHRAAESCWEATRWDESSLQNRNPTTSPVHPRWRRYEFQNPRSPARPPAPRPQKFRNKKNPPALGDVPHCSNAQRKRPPRRHA